MSNRIQRFSYIKHNEFGILIEIVCKVYDLKKTMLKNHYCFKNYLNKMFFKYLLTQK